MSVYGYPREPEGTGDEIPPPDVPYRVTSQPVSVPDNPPPAPPEPLLPPPEPLLPPAGPPQPLLPAHPPDASYAPVADLIPTQRQAQDSPSAPVTASGGLFGGRPDERDAHSRRHPTDTGEDTAPAFEWLRPARSSSSGLGPSAAPPPPADPPVLPPIPEPPSGSVPPPVSASPPMGQPSADPSSRPGFGPSPTMGQPPVPGGLAEDRPGSGPLGPMSQPPAAAGVASAGGASPAGGSAFPGGSGLASGPSPAEGASAVAGDRPADVAGPDAAPLPRRTSAFATGAAGTAEDAEAVAVGAAPVPPPAPVSPPAPEPSPAPASVPPPASTPPASGTAPPTSPPPAFVPGPPASPPGAAGSPTGPSSTVRPTAGDAPEIPPWDRRPLLVVIASAVVLVLIGIVSGVVTAALASTPLASWNEEGSSEQDPLPSPSADPSAAPPPEGETITLAGVGDVIMGSANLGLPPNEGAGFFDAVRDALAADLVMGNLDMTLSDPTGFEKCSPDATDCFQLSLPPSYAKVLRDGGFGLMNLANNHTYDMGQQGYTNTRAALEAVGIAATGGVDEVTHITVKGIRVAVLGFSVYSYTANLNDIDGAAELVRQAAAQADLVVVQMQGGAEGSDRTRVPPAGQHELFGGEDRGDLRGFAHAVVDAGADIVFGHGPHVMRGMEFYQGRLIAYSLGNFCGYAVLSSSGWSGVGGILKATLTRDGSWVAGELVATEMVNRGLPALDEERRALAFVDGLSVADFGDAAARIDHTTGVITAP